MRKICFRRLIALAMTFCMIGSIIPAPIFAYATGSGSGIIQITEFESLQESVQARRVPLGISLVDLGLPSELTATVYSVSPDTTPNLPPEQEEPTDSGEAETKPETTPEVDQPTQPETTPEGIQPTQPETPPADEANSSETPAPDASTDPAPPVDEETTNANQGQPEQTSATSGTPLQIDENDVPLAASPSEPEQAEEPTDEPSEEPTQPQPETTTIRGVAWESNPIYDENITGEYIFTAILPEPYVAAEGVTLPEITVTVYDSAKVIRAWEWNDPERYLTEDTLALSGVNKDNPLDLDTLISMLPASINATLESPAVQDSGEVENAPIPVALQWNSKDFVQAEDGSWPVQGSYLFTAAMPEGYTLAEGAPALEITVQLGGSMLLPNAGVFTKLEIREESATGSLIVNLLEAGSASGDWKLSVGKDYYLNAELTKPQDATHVQIRYGNEDGTYNGVTLANVPGNTYDSGGIQHDYFDELSAYENFTDPTYGSGNTPLALQDGTLVYHIKGKTGTDADKVSFSIGLVVKDEVFDGQDIQDAISVSVGTYNDTTFASANDATQTVALKMQSKQSFNTSITASPATAEIGKDGSGIASAACFSNISNEITVSALYDKVEFDVTYPLHTELSIGFHNTTFTKVHGTFGTMTVGEPVTVDSNKQKIRITLNHGYKSSGAELKIFIQPKFLAEGGFQPGDKPQITMSAVTVTMGTQAFSSATGDRTVTYTLVDSGDDKTMLRAKPRTIYNNTIDLGEDATYMVPMGVTQLANENAASPTPYEKTYEAQFNTSNTAAVISAITVPIGTSETPVVTWTGVTADGIVKSGTVDTPANYLNKKENWTVSTHLLLLADDFGILSFTSVKAEIGNIRPKYNLSDGDYTVQYSLLNCASFGYFTTAEPGLVVKSSYHVYNTDPALRDRTNGDLSVETTVTSTDICRMTLAANEVKLGGKKIDSNTEVQGGALATLTGTLAPYTRPPRSYVPSYKTQIGTAAFITDPILYLTIPQGMTVEEQDLDFKMLKNPIYGSATTENLSHTIENVSYLNTTEDNVSIYKITFPDGTPFGYYDVLGNEFKISYTIPLRTSRSLETKRCNVNDLVVVTGRNGFTAVPFTGVNSTNATSVFSDKYGLNGGEAVSGIAACADATPIGFNVQRQSEINVYSAVSVTKIGGEAVSENRWYSYSSDPNSIALLGQNSEGRLRLQVSNTSDTPGKNLRIVLPIPQKDADIGNEFMDAASGFTMSMTYDAKESATGFSATYIKMTGSYDSITDKEKLVSYTECSRQEANAVLFTADSVAKGEYYIYLDFAVANGTPKSVDIWRPVYAYSVETDRRVSNGSYVASEVAASSISGVAFADVNRNGRQDEGEDGAADITVVAKDAQNRLVSTKTAADGSYQFLAIRESTIDMSFTLSAEGQKTLRFNVPALPDGTIGIASTVIPAADGLSATKTFAANAGEEKVHAAVDGFVSLIYDANTATGSLPKPSSHVKGTAVSVAVKPDNLAKTGYTFQSWNTKADGSGIPYRPGAKITVTANTTLYAIWELASYTVTFNYRGATGGNDEGSRVLAHNDTYGKNKNLPTPTKNGYTFGGWTTSASTSTPKIVDATKFILGTDTTLYALWTPKTMKVTYDANGGNGTIAEKSVSWEAGVLPTDDEATGITKNGFTLSGWTYSGTPVAKTDTYAGLAVNDTVPSIELTAQWQAKGGYTVKYNTDGSTTITDKTGVKWTDTHLLPPTNPTKADNAFAGWKLGAVDVLDNSSYSSLAIDDAKKEITLTAQWTAVKGNVVSYDTDGGSPVNDKVDVANDAINLLPTTNPTKSGYTLDKWVVSGTQTEVTSATKYSAISSSAKTVTLKAIWTAQSYTVKYNSSGGSAVSDKTGVKWTDTGLLPTQPPTLTGYTFDGWYYNGTKVTAATKVSALIPQDDAPNNTITLTAKWIERTYTVQYNGDGGGNFTPKTNVKYTATGLLPDIQPVRLGYTFEGWYVGDKAVKSDTTCGSLLTDEEATGITLTAKWEAKTGFTVQYDTDGGTPTPASKTVAWNATNLLPSEIITKTGYTFKNWLSGRTNVSDATAFSALVTSDQPGTSVTLVAQWAVKDGYIVKYDSDGGSAVSDKTNVKWTDTGLIPPNSPTKVGYQFVEWQYGTTDVAPSSTYGEFAVSDTKMEITLKAVWTEKANYTVKYDTDGGSTVAEKTGVKWTDTGLLPAAEPTKTGYTFAKWQLGTKDISAADSYETLAVDDTIAEITLKAVWTENSSYTVKYNSDGGSTVAEKAGVKWTDTGLLPMTNPTKTGYTFDKWQLGTTDVAATDSYATLAVDDTVTEITLKAVWTENSNYTVKYNSDGGSAVAEKAGVKWTDTGLLPMTNPTKTGYTFDKWQLGTTDVAATDSYATLAVDDTVTEITLKAVWTENSNYTVKYNSDGGSAVADKTNVKWTDTGLLPIANPTKTGYTFDKWQLGTTDVTATDSYATLAVDDTVTEITLKAVWVEKSAYTVKYDTNGGSAVADKTSVKWTDTGLLPSNNPTYDANHAFVEWQYNGVVVTVTDSYSSLAVQDTNLSITLKAVWKSVSDNTVKYNTDGGTVFSDKTGVKPTDKNLLPSPDPVRNGYQFAGWKFGSTPVTKDTVYSTLTTAKELTLTAQWTEKSGYTVKYNTDGGSAVTAKSNVKWTDTNLLPASAPTKEGYTIEKWQLGTTDVTATHSYGTLAVTDTVPEIELKAVWTKDAGAPPDISGTVTDEDGNLVENASVRLTQGNTTLYGPSTTDAQGKYLLTNLQPGIYNLVAEKDNKVVTVIITVTDNDLQQNLVLPTKEKNSVLDVIGSGTPAVVVGNLDEIAKNTPLEAGSNSLTIKLTVQKEAEQSAGKENEHKEIRKEAGTNATILFLDALLTKKTDSNPPVNIGNSNDVVLEVVVPFDLAGKENVRVYRHHDSVNAFRQIASMPDPGTAVDQTCYLDEAAGLIHIYAAKYSTYAIAYDTKGGGGGGGGGGSHQYYDIFLSAGVGGHIQPNKSKVTVREGNSAGFDFRPDTGYRIADVKVDGRSVGAVSEYLFRNVQRDHTLSVSFEKVPVIPDTPVQPPEPDKPISPPTPPVPDIPVVGGGTKPGDAPASGDITENQPNESAPETTPPKFDELEQIKKDVLDDLLQKREKMIDGLPDTLTEEQRKNAVDEINRIYDEKAKGIEAADSAGEVSEAFNKAVLDSEEVLANAGALSSDEPETAKPFVLLSFLLALSAVLFAAISLRRQKNRKKSEDEEDERFSRHCIIAAVSALASAITFLLTTGWHGIILFNGWTMLVAAFAVLTISLSLRKAKKESKEHSC